ncbi:MAG TPA: DUF3108 domain-containing protein [Sulfuriferula sp.]|nr:DUF3108 domain-containing protein [Sulfuriferula sp.]
MTGARDRFNALNTSSRVRGIFLLALALSILAHLLLLAAPGFQLPADDSQETLIQARLEPLPLPKPVIQPKPVLKPKPVIKAPRKPRVKPAPTARPVPEPIASPTPATEAVAPAAPPDTPPAASQEAPADVPASTPDALAPPPLNAMPGKAEIQYTFYWGTNGFRVGRAAYIWQVHGDHYVLTSITEGTGLIALIQPGKLVQISQGHITPLGLAPDDFWIQRGKPTPDKTSAAHFDYLQHTVTVGKMSHATTVPLLPGAQDILSVTFQLAMLAPFQGEQLLYVTTGKGLKPYTAHVVGEDLLDTPLGQLRTLHLARSAEAGEDAIDVWLAEDYNYLPVKIRVDHSKFGVVEQVIRGMSIEH